MKKLAAAALALLLALGSLPAQAADVADLFPVTREWAGFIDVPQAEWYTASVQICYETGLLGGTDSGFAPAGTVTIAEAATLAARMHDILNGGTGIFAASSAGEAWYSSAIKYVEDLGVTGIVNPEAKATRQDFFLLLSAAVADDLLTPINAITTLPDTSNPDVLAFYNAGILTGTDAYGTFNGGGTLTRAEMAAMAARIVRPTLRVSFVPAQKPAAGSETSLAMAALGMAPNAYIATVNGVGIPVEEFLFALCNDIYTAETNLYENYGEYLDWSADYGVGSLSDYFKGRALSSAIANELVRQEAVTRGRTLPADREEAVTATIASYIDGYGGEAALAEELNLYYGCTIAGFERILRAQALDEFLFANLTSDELAAYVAEHDVLRAKHILTSDQTKAEIFLEVVDATPEEFDTLMNEYSEDPGSQSNPNGYLFTAGEFVPEFEAAARTLQYGEHSRLVQSDYGYHIILRLDPLGDPAGLGAYARADLLTAWQAAADIVPATAFTTLDCEAFYYVWLTLMGVY